MSMIRKSATPKTSLLLLSLLAFLLLSLTIMGYNAKHGSDLSQSGFLEGSRIQSRFMSFKQSLLGENNETDNETHYEESDELDDEDEIDNLDVSEALLSNLFGDPNSALKKRKLVIGPYAENRTIFLVESTPKLTKFRLKFLCAIVSLANENPSFTVAVLALSLRAVLNMPSYLYNYQNIVVRAIDPDDFFASTPLATVWKNGQNSIQQQVLNDMLRFTLVNKYGGLYVEHDIISNRPLPETLNNFVVAEEKFIVGSSIMKFDRGHPILKSILDTMIKEFKDGLIPSNASSLLTQATLKYCSGPDKEMQTLQKLKCPDDFRVLPTSSAYPITPSNFMELYTEAGKEIAKGILARNDTIIVTYYAQRFAIWKETKNLTDIVLKSGQPVYAMMYLRCALPQKMEFNYNVGVSWSSPVV